MECKFKLNDKVSFLNEKGRGIVTGIISTHRVLVTNQDSFELPYSVSDLVPFSNPSSYATNIKSDVQWAKDKEEEEIKPPRLETDEIWEIDLHMNELMDIYANKSDHEKLQMQLRYFRKYMDTAILHRIEKIVFIHGVGKGTLRQEIIHELRNYDHIRFYDAPFRKYGYGATLVEFL